MFSGLRSKYAGAVLTGIATLFAGLAVALSFGAFSTSQAYARESKTPSSVPSAVATVQPLCTVAFADVKPGESPFYSYVRVLACRNIISGYADGTFRPNNNVTRGQLAKMVAASAGYNDAVPSNRWTFHNIEPGSTYWLFVERVAAHGVTSGYACSNAAGSTEPCDDANRRYFRPGDYATRQQVAKMVSDARGTNARGSNVPPAAPTTTVLNYTFADVPVTNDFYRYVEALAASGSLSGYTCGGSNPETGSAEPCDAQNRKYFRPASNMSRGQISKVLATGFFSNAVAPGQ